MKQDNKKRGYLNISPLLKLILCLSIPLILVFGFVCLNGGPNSSNWVVLNSSTTSGVNSREKHRVSVKDLRSKIDGVAEETSVATEDSVLSQHLETQAAAAAAASSVFAPVRFLAHSFSLLLFFFYVFLSLRLFLSLHVNVFGVVSIIACSKVEVIRIWYSSTLVP